MLRGLGLLLFTAVLILLVREVVKPLPEFTPEVAVVPAKKAVETPAAVDPATPVVEPPAEAPAGEPDNEALISQVLVDGAIQNAALLTFRNHAAFEAFLKRASAAGLVVTGRLDALNALRVAFDNIDKLKRDLRDHGDDYSRVGANFPVSLPGLPTQEQRKGGGDAPFGDALLASIGAGPSVDRSLWGNEVTVAVIDSGVTNHPAFREGQVVHIDLVNDGKAFEGHGTAIASLIAGDVPGAQGVSPAAKILDVRIADGTGGSDSFQLARGIQTAVDRGAQIINISMGSYGDSPLVADAIQNAIAKGIIVVASAGNEQSATKTWPAAYKDVISVSGVDAKGQLAYFSNSGDPTISAPGVGVPSAYAQNSKPLLAQGDGTSQAAALVSGAAAAIRSAGGDVISVLTKNAINTGLTRHETGAGMLRLPTTLK